ncbi:MAG: bifunctional phosphoribosyl-AMP cyclohydrolase/phosphoribosyl-ATP diphosphatase HisIE [Candidatus Micrarchaeia archaeon]
MKLNRKEAEKFARSLDYRKGGGLVAAIAQSEEGEVLMQAFQNREAVARTLESGKMHYYSREMARLWRKGEESGNEQTLLAFYPDCDRDAVLYVVSQKGVACHTGARTCFRQPARFGLRQLFRVIQERKKKAPAGSYTRKLLRNKRLALAKLREEAEEFAEAVERKGKRAVVWEAADLAYHVLVGLASRGLSLEDVEKELARRRK